ncbi:PRC-barrel domain-containing protein [Aureibacillus halotolerans]|uniref:PRC-barrel domain protein n=1 Tax=Aureibacillus halotolerans TaxID=1508390 RepID=A0A4R6U6P9_9BACI|nr:PRC-barrel domain-containing protein [Aureibacillus halotolerans]TDQ42178.1 PRC-barrel domain protein [Aureibacillus halotolerans]
MLYQAKDLESYKLGAVDGEVGKVKDFYFDDQSFVVRYVVADTRTWFFGGKVLLSPKSFERLDPQEQLIHVNLTKDQIKDSPKPEEHEPINRQYEKELSDFHGWGYYWLGSGNMAGGGYNSSGTSVPGSVAPLPPIPEELGNEANKNRAGTQDDIREGHEEKELEEHLRHDDSALQSVDDIKGYDVHAKEGEIGKIRDVVIEGETQKIRYLVIDTGSTFNRQTILLSPEWVKDISWIDRTVTVPLEHDLLQNAPVFEHDQAITRDYEERLFTHYNRPHYWTK